MPLKAEITFRAFIILLIDLLFTEGGEKSLLAKMFCS